MPLTLPFERRGGDFVVGFAGRIVEQKGWRVLVRAIELLPREVRLVVAGDGDQLPELEAAAAQPELAGRLFYVGLLPKERLWSFYRALDCLAVPSLTTRTWKEQSAGVLVDGLASGLPVVASASGGIPHVMGQAGILVPENDPRALADALARLRTDDGLRARLGELALRRFRTEFSIPVYADKIAAVLGLRARKLASAG